MKEMTALFPASHWGSNIGNAFFNLGTRYLLDQCDIDVCDGDLPPCKAFGLTKRQRQNDVGYGYRIGDFDFLVLDGPMFDENFGSLFGPYLKNAQERGVKIVLMSAGGIAYTKEEIEHCRAVLKIFPPYILTTRDRQTFDNYGDLCARSYDGICSAWFVPEAYPGYSIPDEKKYVTCCFDHTFEPRFSLPSDGAFKRSIEIGDVHHSMQTKIGRLFQRCLPKELGGYEIIRPCHQVLNRQNWRLFFKENSFCSQLPYGYLNLYRNTALTITDRLHASVATMAYGNPARLFIKSNRTFLLDRVHAQEVISQVFTIDQIQLRKEKQLYLEWLKSATSS